jgi:hypothetical protein
MPFWYFDESGAASTMNACVLVISKRKVRRNKTRTPVLPYPRAGTDDNTFTAGRGGRECKDLCACEVANVYPAVARLERRWRRRLREYLVELPRAEVERLWRGNSMDCGLRWMIKNSIGEFQWLESTYPEHVRRVQYDQIPSELVLVLLNKLPGS